MNTTLWLEVAREAYEAQQQEQMHATRKKMLLDQLKEISENKSASYGDYVFMMSMRKGSVDYAAIPELKAINVEQYRKDQVVTWKLMKMGEQ